MFTALRRFLLSALMTALLLLPAGPASRTGQGSSTAAGTTGGVGATGGSSGAQGASCDPSSGNCSGSPASADPSAANGGTQQLASDRPTTLPAHKGWTDTQTLMILVVLLLGALVLGPAIVARHLDRRVE